MPGLSEVVVSKDELLERIKENREKHIEDVAKLQDAYQKALIAELEEKLQDVKEGKDLSSAHIRAIKPEDHTKDYDTVIAMVDMSVVSTVELTHNEFKQYVQDDWGWKQSFVGTLQSYDIQ